MKECNGEICENDIMMMLNDTLICSLAGITSVAVDIGVDTVLVETTLPSGKIKELIEATGKQAVIRGLGSTQGKRSAPAGKKTMIFTFFTGKRTF